MAVAVLTLTAACGNDAEEITASATSLSDGTEDSAVAASTTNNNNETAAGADGEPDAATDNENSAAVKDDPPPPDQTQADTAAGGTEADQTTATDAVSTPTSQSGSGSSSAAEWESREFFSTSGNNSTIGFDGEIKFAPGEFSGFFPVDTTDRAPGRIFFDAGANQPVLIVVNPSGDYLAQPATTVTLRNTAGAAVAPSVNLTEAGIWDGRLPADGIYTIDIVTDTPDYYLEIEILGADELDGPGQYEEIETLALGDLSASIFAIGEEAWGGRSQAVVTRDGNFIGTVPFAIELTVAAGDDLTTDLNDDGLSDLVVTSYSGGTHCCWATTVFSETLDTPMWEVATQNCGANFEDLDGNGTYEFLTCDDSFAYEFCAYVASPKIGVTLEWSGADGRWIPATPTFTRYFDDPGPWWDELAAEAADPEVDFDFRTCAAMGESLHHLYNGSAVDAYQALERNYTGDGLDVLWSLMLRRANGSRFFVAPVDQNDRPPAVLFHFKVDASCNPEISRGRILVTLPGEDRCGESTWEFGYGFELEEMLEGTGLIAEDETAQITQLSTGEFIVAVERYLRPFDSVDRAYAGELVLDGEVVLRLDENGEQIGAGRIRGNLVGERVR